MFSTALLVFRAFMRRLLARRREPAWRPRLRGMRSLVGSSDTHGDEPFSCIRLLRVEDIILGLCGGQVPATRPGQAWRLG